MSELTVNTIQYTLTRRHIRTMRISINHTCAVTVTASPLIPQIIIDSYVRRKSEWIHKKLDYFKKNPINKYSLLLRTKNRREYLRIKDEALRILTERTEYFNKQYNFEYKRISIRNQYTRWGSCSARGNINFNYKLILLPDELRDYVVVHELCHLAELNHSRSFWNLVERATPNYKKLQKKLRGLD